MEQRNINIVRLISVYKTEYRYARTLIFSLNHTGISMIAYEKIIFLHQ